jgi:Mrp family chromosome partitioning ATPase
MVVQDVLKKLIEAYYKKHVETHKTLGIVDDFLTQETDRLAQSLRQTEEDLRALKAKAGVGSPEEAKKAYAERYSRLREELDAAEAELSEHVATLKELQKATLINGANAPTAPDAATNAATVVAVKSKPSSDVIEEYKIVSARLEAAINQETELLKTYTSESSLAKEIAEKIASLKNQKKKMEAANPQLIQEQVEVFRPQNAEPAHAPVIDLTQEYARVAALQAKIGVLTNQFAKVKAETGQVDDIETSYTALLRKKEQQEQQYKYYSRSLDQARVDSQLGSGKLPNIIEIQSPSLPMQDTNAVKKKMVSACAGGIGGGIAIAFLLELVLAQGIRKPSELETNYNLPVFLTIPVLDRVGKRSPVALLPSPSGNGSAEHDATDGKDGSPGASAGDHAIANGAANGHALVRRESSVEIAPWDAHHDLHAYSEALRDRLITHFEMKGMTHKPKLVALTSCLKGSGVTTLALGLAASLSETGEGNVLLVDMNLERGAAHPFYRGKPACGIADALDGDKRQEAQVQENLYVVQGTGMDDRLPKMMPKRLAHLIPKLHASDYDYIIFDMPPITQTSITPRLAGFMDMVFMVVEEETNRDWVKQASDLLHQSKANVGAVFNKRKKYAPHWLHQEF